MKRAAFFLILLLAILPYVSMASAYWMDVKGSGKLNQPVFIKIYYGNIDESGIRKPLAGSELILTGEFRISVVNSKGERKIIPIFLKEDCWEGTFTPQETGAFQILGINDTHPVVDRSKTGGKNVLPIDYLCAVYHVESAEEVSKPVQYLDIITAKKDKLIIVKAFNSGIKAAIATKVRVFNPENWEKELSIDENGEAVFLPTMKGLYIIREDWTDPKQGTYKGVAYTSIRHRCNYFLQIQ